jgi:hypothetical protein
MLPVTAMINIQRPVYDFELMERMNHYLVVSVVLTGIPSRTTSAGKLFSFLDMLPVTTMDTEPSAQPILKGTQS